MSVVGVVALLSLWLVSSVLAALPADSTIADFTSPGTTVGSCYVGPSTSDGVDGEVTLLPALGADFANGNFPTGWITYAWQPGGAATISDGVMTVNNAVISGTAVSAPASIEFMALVADDVDQNAGFFNFGGTDFAPPWAFFGSYYLAPPALRARTYDGTTVADTVLTGGTLGSWQRYRIDWTTSGVTYSVNDVITDSQPASLATMNPMFSENAQETMQVDWLRMGPYAPANCIYTSHLYDSGYVNPDWITLTTSTYVPANTTLSFETRSGAATDTSDPSWSNWEALSGGNIASPGQRYLQYRALLASTDSLATPRIYSVQPQGTSPTAVTFAGVTGRSTPQPLSAWTVLLAGIFGALGLILIRYRARQARKVGQ
jgi:hypothetical protein